MRVMAVSILSPKDMLARLAGYAAELEGFLSAWLAANAEAPEILRKAMAYTLEAGGKRIRPALCCAWTEMAGGKARQALPFAAAFEMIHTYSLIHDDLPAMDNDDLRRGKPSCHCAFGEATAILAGDALLTDAFGVALQTDCSCKALHAALAVLAQAAGSAGMVGGQILDMEYGATPGLQAQELAHMQALKTGAMLRAACVCGAMLAGADADLLHAADSYGTALGKAFQITDDILDVTGDTAEMGKPSGSDVKQGKITWPLLLGLEASRLMARDEAQKAADALAGLDLPSAPFLRALAAYVVERRS